MKARFDHIDIAKGISLILVVIFHSDFTKLYPEISDDLSVARMPLFFFLSGIFFSYRQQVREFVVKKFEGLLKPYFFVLISLTLLLTIIGNANPISEILGILYGGHVGMLRWGQLWFLGHLFFVFGFTYCLYRYTGFSGLTTPIQWLLVLTSFFVGCYTFGYMESDGLRYLILPWAQDQALLGLPYSADLIPVTGAYFVAGILLREHVKHLRPDSILIGLALLVFVAVSVFSDADVRLPFREIIAPLPSLIGTIAGIYLLLQLSLWISQTQAIKKYFNIVGQSTLFILIFHGVFLRKIQEFLESNLADRIPYEILIFVSIFLAIVISLLIKMAVERSQFLSLFFFPAQGNPLWERLRLSRPFRRFASERA